MSIPLQVASNVHSQQIKSYDSINQWIAERHHRRGFFNIVVSMSISFVFPALTMMPASVECCTSSSTYVCMQDMSGLFRNSVIVVSSTYLWVIHVGRNESIRITNVSGPSYDPCGIPADISNHSETTSPILTLWRRLLRNEYIHRMMTSGRPSMVSLATKTLWSTWSKAFLKSTNTVRTDWPLSTALCQWCNTSIRAWVVERFVRAPYWCQLQFIQTSEMSRARQLIFGLQVNIDKANSRRYHVTR